MDDDEIPVYTCTWAEIEPVLWSRDEFDGMQFEQGKDGATVVYAYGGIWALNLFLLQLAKSLETVMAPGLEGFEQTYHSLASLTMEMSDPRPEPKLGDDVVSCTFPCLRITGFPSHN